MATKTKAAQKEKEKEEAPEKEATEAPDTPLPLLDLSDAAVKKLIRSAKKRGFALGRGQFRADRGHSRHVQRDGGERRRDRGGDRGGGRRARGSRGGARGRERRAGRGAAEGPGQVRDQGADRAHRRPGPHVSAR